jgi:hypothetical protein
LAAGQKDGLSGAVRQPESVGQAREEILIPQHVQLRPQPGDLGLGLGQLA